MCVQGEIGISWNGKCINSECIQQLGCFYLRRNAASGADLGETVGNKQDENNQCAVRRSFNLEISKKRVCTEKIEGFVYNVCDI